MNSICLIDTSIFLNILDVPNRNSQKAETIRKFEEFIELECSFIVPMATIIETGNHIAQNGNGSTRRQVAIKFIDTIEKTFDGQAPFRIADWANQQEMRTWLKDFPDHAGRNKSISRISEGTTFGDLSIIKEYEAVCSKFPMSEVFIWSLDEDLISYHRSQS